MHYKHENQPVMNAPQKMRLTITKKTLLLGKRTNHEEGYENRGSTKIQKNLIY